MADIRTRIAAGEVYQVNLCRMLSARCRQAPTSPGWPRSSAPDNPAPYALALDVPEAGLAPRPAGGRHQDVRPGRRRSPLW